MSILIILFLQVNKQKAAGGVRKAVDEQYKAAARFKEAEEG